LCRFILGELILSRGRDHGVEHRIAPRRQGRSPQGGCGGKTQSRNAQNTLAARVRRAASAPIQDCLLPDALFEAGIGTLILARGVSQDYLNVGVFLVDVSCQGVKNVFFQSIGPEEFESLVATTSATQRLVAVDPCYARKLLRDVAVWSGSIGFSPHRDFAAVEPLFGDVRAEACDVAFRFGRDGKPLYTPGPFETPAQVRRRLEQLRMRLGDDGFESIEAL
jgi:hypothetical protein